MSPVSHNIILWKRYYATRDTALSLSTTTTEIKRPQWESDRCKYRRDSSEEKPSQISDDKKRLSDFFRVEISWNMSDKDPVITVEDLPMAFTVKYLGNHPAKGLWGMKHTRKPVDYLVSQAKNLPTTTILPIVRVQITKEGVNYVEITDKKTKSEPVAFPVDVISYGVQDLVYTRVFSMIIVTEDNLDNGVPFVCHSFVCESRDQARKITYALAAAFQDYGRRVKEENKDSETPLKRFAIDLRTPEEQAAASDEETDA